MTGSFLWLRVATMRIGPYVVLAALIGLWAAVSAFGWVPPMFLPSPGETAQALWRGLNDGPLVDATMSTLERMFYGWFLASALGFVLGTLIGMSAPLRAWLQPTLEFIRPLPASAVMPVAIALLGLSPGMVLAVIAFGAIWPVMLATIHGFSSVEPRLAEVSRVLGLSRAAFVVKIAWPHSLPDVLTGMRLSLTISLVLAIVGEMLASQSGLGSAILLAARSFQSADLYAGVALLGAIGFLSNWLLTLTERGIGRRHPQL